MASMEQLLWEKCELFKRESLDRLFDQWDHAIQFILLDCKHSRRVSTSAIITVFHGLMVHLEETKWNKGPSGSQNHWYYIYPMLLLCNIKNNAFIHLLLLSVPSSSSMSLSTSSCLVTSTFLRNQKSTKCLD